MRGNSLLEILEARLTAPYLNWWNRFDCLQAGVMLEQQAAGKARMTGYAIGMPPPPLSRSFWGNLLPDNYVSDNASTSTTKFARGIFCATACSIMARKAAFMRSRLADFNRKW